MDKIPVLIVGAGPSGLMLACQLARHGVAFRIIDTKSGPTKESRAMGLHARSIEAYAQLSLEDAVESMSEVMKGIQMYTKGNLCMTVNLEDMGSDVTPYAGFTILEQSKNESMLYEKLVTLGGDVEWGVGFEGMEMRDTSAIVTLSGGARVEAQWVVACDGARSPVRHACELKFEGGTYNATFYVADVDVEDGELSKEYGSMFLNDEGFVLTFKMSASDKRYRLIGAVPSEAHEKPGWLENPDFSLIADAFKRLTNKSLQLAEPDWFATYSVHHRKLNSFRHRRALFVGDAAHVHSPAGGQGMNTGLLDAHNLGWKLGLVTSGLASEKLVDSYNVEREAFAMRLLSTTDTGFHALSGPGMWSRVFRLNIIPLVLPTLLKIPAVRSYFFYNISQTAISYSTSALSKGPHRAGDRFPMLNVRVDGGELVCSFELFKNAGFYAFDFTGSGDGSELVDTVAKKCGVHINYYKCEADGKEMAKANVKKMLYIVRPDMYIGFSAHSVDMNQVLAYFNDVVLC